MTYETTHWCDGIAYALVDIPEYGLCLVPAQPVVLKTGDWIKDEDESKDEVWRVSTNAVNTVLECWGGRRHSYTEETRQVGVASFNIGGRVFRIIEAQDLESSYRLITSPTSKRIAKHSTTTEVQND